MVRTKTTKRLPYMLVRIRTFCKGTGHVARRFTYQGRRFDIDQGWKQVGRGMSAELAVVKHPSTGALVFEVEELETAKEISQGEAHEPWAHGQIAPERAAQVKIGEFKRREEIKKEREGRETDNDEQWDDPPPRSVSRATTPPPSDPDPQDPPSPSKKTKTAGKRKVQRRSASK